MNLTDHFATINNSIMKLPPGLHFYCKHVHLQDSISCFCGALQK